MATQFWCWITNTVPSSSVVVARSAAPGVAAGGARRVAAEAVVEVVEAQEVEPRFRPEIQQKHQNN